MGDEETFTIEELANAAGMTPRNVRAYRTKGLLPPPDRAGRSSSYRAVHLTRLRHIHELREAGLPLKLIIEAARRGDDLSPLGPLSMLTATLATQPVEQDLVVDVAALEIDHDTREKTAGLLPPGSAADRLAQRLSGHGVAQATILLILLTASRSARALSAELVELLRKDLLTSQGQELPASLLDDITELAVLLTEQAFTQNRPAPLT